MLRLHVLTHVPFEGPAHIAAWARDRGHALHGTRLDAGEALPALDAFDWLIIMGGPMNIYDDASYPWLKTERRFIYEALSSGKKILGICLGAQFLADALGSPVSPGTFREIGWYPVHMVRTPADCRLFQDFPASFTAFHWHGDTFAMPKGATHIARSAACESQAFVYQDRVVGLQFHLESTEESVELLLRHCAEEITEAPYVQDPATIRRLAPKLCPQAQMLLEKLLDRLAE